MVTKESHYRDHSPQYGMSHTRRDRILELVEGTRPEPVEGSGMRILDVGCASGTFGARIKERDNWVGGIELSRIAVGEAKERLDVVWSFDIENEWPSELQNKDMDLVIASEVLEHVFDPVAVLRSVHAALKPGGAVIVTTPNFMTWTNRLKFLFGRFRYEEQGMFDFGHIRWFTHAYLKEVLAETGFRVTHERHIIFPGKLTRILRRWPPLFAWQFIVKATKK